ncbi:MAG: DUF2062 domain-containing protein [Brevinematia bacterium]
MIMNLKYTIIGKFLRWILVSFKKVIHLRDSTHQIALGFSIGVSVGILPTFGFGALILAFLSIVIRFNLFSAIVGTLINNPLLVPFWLVSSYKIGEIITKVGIDLEGKNLLQNTLDFSISYITGNIILSLICGFISYVLMYIIVEVYRSSRGNLKRQQKD